jgi:hypothetical protein
VISSPGGTVVATCSAANENATVYLVSWSPAQGYTVHQSTRGPSHEVEITFNSSKQAVNVTIHCSSSGPVAEIEIERND